MDYSFKRLKIAANEEELSLGNLKINFSIEGLNSVKPEVDEKTSDKISYFMEFPMELEVVRSSDGKRMKFPSDVKTPEFILKKNSPEPLKSFRKDILREFKDKVKKILKDEVYKHTENPEKEAKMAIEDVVGELSELDIPIEYESESNGIYKYSITIGGIFDRDKFTDITKREISKFLNKITGSNNSHLRRKLAEEDEIQKKFFMSEDNINVISIKKPRDKQFFEIKFNIEQFSTVISYKSGRDFELDEADLIIKSPKNEEIDLLGSSVVNSYGDTLSELIFREILRSDYKNKKIKDQIDDYIKEKLKKTLDKKQFEFELDISDIDNDAIEVFYDLKKPIKIDLNKFTKISLSNQKINNSNQNEEEMTEDEFLDFSQELGNSIIF